MQIWLIFFKKGTIYELTLNLFLRQLKSIWMSIIVNARISFVFALMKCCFAAFREQNKIATDSKCQQVYKSLKKTLASLPVALRAE